MFRSASTVRVRQQCGWPVARCAGVVEPVAKKLPAMQCPATFTPPGRSNARTADEWRHAPVRGSCSESAEVGEEQGTGRIPHPPWCRRPASVDEAGCESVPPETLGSRRGTERECLPPPQHGRRRGRWSRRDQSWCAAGGCVLAHGGTRSPSHGILFIIKV